MWWHERYPFRRNLDIVPTADGLPVGHPITIQIPQDWVDKGKVRVDLTDLEVLRLVGEDWVVMPSRLDGQELTFDLPETLSAVSEEYFLYYGNETLADAPVYVEPTPNPWPVRDGIMSDYISFTRPGEHWIDGVSSHAGAVATYQFYGTKVKLDSFVGPDKGIIDIQTDFGMWETVDLFSVTEEVRTVWERQLLGTGLHEVRVRVTGRQNPGSDGHEVNIQFFEQSKAYSVIDQGEQINDYIWITMTGGM